MTDSVAREHPLTRLLRYARGHRAQLIVATVYSVLNKLFDLAPPVLIGAAVDIVVAKEASFLARFGITDVLEQLWLLALVTLLVWGLESLFEYLYSLKWRGLAQSIQHQLRLDAYRQVQTLDLSYFEDQSTGGLLAVLNDDVNQLERFLDDGANQLIQLLTTLVVVGTLFFVLVPDVAWMAVLPMPVVVFGSVWFQRHLEPLYADVRRHVGELNGQLANNLGGILVIKSFVTEQHEVREIDKSSRAYASANRRAIRLSSLFVPLIRMAIVLGFAAMLVYGGEAALNGELKVGAYSIVVFMTQRLLWPLTRLGTMLDQYQRAMASTTRALDLLDTRPSVTSGSRRLRRADVAGELELADVGFSYPRSGGRAVIEDLSIKIPAGQTVAFVGPTGGGKTTLIKLLLRFYDVTRGEIRLDGIPLADLELGDLRRSVGLVSQDVFLFHGSVRDNIAYGSFDAPMEKIIEAAKVAEAHAFIETLPQGYDTIVGERGQKLSGGQRQRISLARAVLKDPPVLILDEATSSIDNETEAAIQRSLERIALDRTTLVIAHRLSTVRHAHCTYVLDGGRIVERGNHSELLKKDGMYAALWRVQTGDTQHAA